MSPVLTEVAAMFDITFFATFAVVVFMCEVLPALLAGFANISQGKRWDGSWPKIGG